MSSQDGQNLLLTIFDQLRGDWFVDRNPILPPNVEKASMGAQAKGATHQALIAFLVASAG